MATYVVTTKTDEADTGATDTAPLGTGLSLREAVALANANAGADTIVFSSSDFTGGAASLIRLTLGEIAITDAVTIDGSGATGLVITGDKNNDDVNLAGTELTDAFTSNAAQLADNSRIFISGNTTVSISDMTLTGGRTTANSDLGGAISAGTLNLTDVTLTGNSTAGASSYGSAVAANTLALENVTVAGNASQSGLSVVGTNLTILNSTITGNTGTVFGGGVGAPSVSITNSIITGNTVDVFQTAGTTSYQGLNIIGVSSQTLPSGTVISPDASDVFAATTQLPQAFGSSVAGVLDTSGSRPIVPLKTNLNNPAIDASNNTAPTTDALGKARTDQPTVSNANGSAADLGAAESGLIRTASATFTVTTANDELDSTKIGATLADMGGANDLSLREAIFLANQEGGSADIISFSSSVFTGGAANLIRLTLGEINITDAVTIDASSAGGITITGDKNNDDITEAGSEITNVTASLTGSDRLVDNSRIFVIDDLSPTTLKALTITGGRTTASNNLSPLPINNGGAIKSASDLTIIDSTIAGNSTKGGEAGGGAIYSGAKLTVDGSTVRDNLTSGQASGGAVLSVGAVTVSDSLFANNKTLNVTPSLLVSAGGAIAAVGQVEVTNSTFSGNSVAADGAGGGAIISAGNVILNGSTIQGNSVTNSVGGGISSGASISATNSTISGNTTNGDFAPGAGLAAVGSVSLTNSTVSGNATVGANSLGAGIFANGTITLTNSIVLGNNAAQASADELYTGASVVANGLNIVGANQAAFDVTGHTGIVNANPASVFAQTVANGSATAGVLANNGGPVQTIALKADATNPALDASNTSAPTLDAAGHLRLDAPGVASANGSIADLGAAEAAEFPSLVVTTNLDVVDAFDGKTSLREAIAYANSHVNAAPNTPDVITFDASVFTGGAASLIRLTQGEIVITDAVEIDGSTGTGIVITGDKNDDDVTVGVTDITDVAASYGGTPGAASDLLDDNSRIFNVTSNTAATTFQRLTLTGGRTTTVAERGGAVTSESDLTLIASVITGNSTSGSQAAGGGLAVVGTLTLTDSTLSGNSTAGVSKGWGGGAIADTIIATGSTIAGNHSALAGGGIWGVFVNLTNSTVSGNSAQGGGGIGALGSATIENSIVLGNLATIGTEIVLSPGDPGNNVPAATLTATGANIVGANSTAFDTTGVANVINADPTKVFAQTVDIGGGVLAGVLADNGGPVQTIALKFDAANPALDSALGSPPATDARGEARQDLAGIGSNGANFADLGAFEAVDQPPTVLAISLFPSIAENTPTTTAIKFASLSIVDPDGNNTLSLSGADAAMFEIQSDGIYLSAGATLDFETNPVLDVTLDVATLGNGNYSATATFNVTDVNEAPTVLALNNPATVLPENTSTASRVKVADIVITDDALGTETITLGGADAALFEADGGVLYIKAGTVLDFETNPKLDVTVTAQDLTVGGPLTQALSVTLTDVNEAPTTVNFTNVLGSIAENASTAARIKVADIVITDDALGSETITLAGADAAKFEVINGVLYIKAGTVLNFEADSSLDVTVNIDDPTVGGAIDLSRALSVAVTDIAETINGTAAADALNGGVGADRIFGLGGNDTINGGAGNDSIIGGAGVDRMTGGTGADTFIFSSITQSGYKVSGSAVEGGPLVDTTGASRRDIITDFTHGTDRIDVSLIDANENVAGNQAFAFRGTGSFSGSGSIVYRQFNNAGTANDHTIVYFDTTGDGRSDMMIELTGLKVLTAVDFIL